MAAPGRLPSFPSISGAPQFRGIYSAYEPHSFEGAPVAWCQIQLCLETAAVGPIFSVYPRAITIRGRATNITEPRQWFIYELGALHNLGILQPNALSGTEDIALKYIRGDVYISNRSRNSIYIKSQFINLNQPLPNAIVEVGYGEAKIVFSEAEFNRQLSNVVISRNHQDIENFMHECKVMIYLTGNERSRLLNQNLIADGRAYYLQLEFPRAAQWVQLQLIEMQNQELGSHQILM